MWQWRLAALAVVEVSNDEWKCSLTASVVLEVAKYGVEVDRNYLRSSGSGE